MICTSHTARTRWMSMVAAFTHLGLKSKPNPQAVTPDYGLQVFGFSRVQPL